MNLSEGRTPWMCLSAVSTLLVVYLLLVASRSFAIQTTQSLHKSHSITIADEIRHLRLTQSELLQYPTRYTQGIVPVNVHSHNDYWREVPALTAISYGCASIEADVWLEPDGTLLVGHEPAALSPSRTFASLYIEPLVRILDQMNSKTHDRPIKRGVFDMDPEKTLQLLVDFKTDGHELYSHVLKALQPLRSKGYLTSYNQNEGWTTGPIVVIGTGNVPLDLVEAESTRDLFFDGPLQELTEARWTKEVAPLASANWAKYIGYSGIGEMSKEARAKLVGMIDAAHARGIKTRFWGEPLHPMSARDTVWKLLIELGSDWINADDLSEAVKL